MCNKHSFFNTELICWSVSYILVVFFFFIWVKKKQGPSEIVVYLLGLKVGGVFQLYKPVILHFEKHRPSIVK